MEDIRKLGFKQVILKSDKEPAIVRQVVEIAKMSGIEVIAEYSHTDNPQSNGMAERTVGAIKGKSRSIMAGLEARFNKKIPATHPVIGWAVEHVADCMNRYIIGSDGRTAMARAKGQNHRQPVAEFGETVMFKMLDREKKAWNRQDSDICGRWAKGVWLGRRWDSYENIVMTKFGVSNRNAKHPVLKIQKY